MNNFKLRIARYLKIIKSTGIEGVTKVLQNQLKMKQKNKEVELCIRYFIRIYVKWTNRKSSS